MTDLAEDIINAKIYTDTGAVASLITSWKIEGKEIVFTNGVFDLLHIGHITYLAKASAEGDKLILGLNSDASVNRIKGENRPVNLQATRAAILASFFFIDAVVIFDEDTPLNLITAVQPHVLVKGADYATEEIVGGKEVIAAGGRVTTISFIEGHSSSLIINKIKSGT